MFGKLMLFSILVLNTLMVLDARAEGGSIAGQMIDPGRSVGGHSPASVGEFGHGDVESDATDAEMRHMRRRQQVFSDIRRENNKRPLDLLPKANTFRMQGR